VRLAFFGTPSDAVPALHALHAAGHDIPIVVSQPDRRRGRGTAEIASPVKIAAVELGLLVRTPERSSEVIDDVIASGVELGVVIAFGQLLPVALLDAVPHGFVNVHFSVLPRWRGAAPVERAILAGDRETGVCIMALEAGLDTGPVYARATTPIAPDETAGELRARLVELGTDLLLTTVPEVATRIPEPQVGEPSYAEKLTVEEFALDWSRPASELARVVRAGNPRPGAWTVDHGRRVKVWRARAHEAQAHEPPGRIDEHGMVVTGAGRLELVEVQPEGKRPMPAPAWLAGRRDTAVGLGS